MHQPFRASLTSSSWTYDLSLDSACGTCSGSKLDDDGDGELIAKPFAFPLPWAGLDILVARL